MTVSELIEKLKEMPQDAIVVNSDAEDDYQVGGVTYLTDLGAVEGHNEYVYLTVR